MIPKAVVEAGARADAYYAERSGVANTGKPAGTDGSPTQTEAAPVVAQVPAVAATPQPSAFDTTFEQQFRVLQGKYNSEVPRLHQQIKDLTAKVSSLETENTNLKAQGSSAVNAGQNRTVRPEDIDLSSIPAATREQYGEEFLRTVALVAAANMKPAPASTAQPVVDLSPLQRQVQELQQEVGATKEEKFFTALTKAAPHWEQLNTDVKFLEWLKERDAFTGAVRQAIFNDAFKNFDVNRIAAFFNTFRPSSQTENRSTATSLEAQVVPPNRGSGEVPDLNVDPNTKPWFTTQNIARFYDDVRRGAFKGKEADMQRIEQDIFAAQREGRVRKA